jgi:hypothetical protein
MRRRMQLGALIGCLAFVAAIAGHARAASTGYVQTNLVSDIPGLAAHTDPTLLNPWGIAFFPGASPFWVNDNNAGLSALYFGTGLPFPSPPSVTIPAPTSPTGGTATGIVVNFFAIFFSANGAFLIPGPSNTTISPQ